jgi:hypothetical protein
MNRFLRVVTSKELACSKHFSPESLAEGASLIDIAKKKFEKDGVVPVEIVRAMMEADGITKEFLWCKSSNGFCEGLLVRAISSHQWFLIDGKNIYGEF